jgi:glycosyltransferase involved in cell wall biosynthesis
MTKVAFLSDSDFRGSGYLNICTNLCKGLAEHGHEVKLVGLGYENNEHYFPYSILPAKEMAEAISTLHNLLLIWQPNVLVVALDLSLQEALLDFVRQNHPNVPYIVITPLEEKPLCLPWAVMLQSAKKVFFISEFGTEEAKAKGVEAEFMQIGIDTQSWRIPTPEEKKLIRSNLLGVDDDTFVILTVADNQERKNLGTTMRIVKKFGESGVVKDYRFVLVSRPENVRVGWRLEDKAMEVGILPKYMQYPRGLPFKELWMLYACADAFLLCSKGEGLGIPVLEAQACGVPVVATQVGAITEHLTRGDGWLIPPEYENDEPFGNEMRYFIDKEQAVSALIAISQGLDVERAVQKAREYTESRTWDIPVNQLHKAIEDIVYVKA